VQQLLNRYLAQRSDQLIAGFPDWMHVHAANVAQLAIKPSAVLMTVRYAPIVSVRFAGAVSTALPASRNAWDRK
jgi:hypothetical protein